MKNRIAATILCLILLLGCLPAATAASVIEISDKAGFAAISEDLTADYQLTADLTFTAADFAKGGVLQGKLPFAAATAFTGSLNGNGHTITGLDLSANYAVSDNAGTITENGLPSAGLFGVLAGTVKDLRLRDAVLNYTVDVDFSQLTTIPPDMRAGFIAATLTKDGVIENCVVNGTLTVDSSGRGRLNVGGLAGLSQGTVRNCAVYGSISVSRDYNAWTTVGGIVGWVDQTTTTVSSCYVGATVQEQGSLAAFTNLHLGAVAGYSSGTVADSYFVGDGNAVGTVGSYGGVTSRCGGVNADKLDDSDSFATLDFTDTWVIQTVGGIQQPLPKLFACVHANVGELELIYAATCGNNGLKQKKCLDCGEPVENEILAATGKHTPGALIVDIPATCAKEGKGHIECAVCGNTVESNIVIGTTGEHTPGAWQVTQKATYTTEGLKTRYCSVCGEPIATQKIAKIKGADTLTIFKDLKKKDWYVTNGSIDFAYNMGYFKGTTATTFEPNTPVTRGMFVTVLGRLHGEKDVRANTQFTDVKKSDYFSGYVAWAAKNGIVNGTGDTTFSPDANITREQICAMMVRYASYANIKLKKVNAAITFKDAGKISGYAKAAVKACQQGGIVSGEKDGNGYNFRPQGNASRAEVATIIMNFYNSYLA